MAPVPRLLPLLSVALAFAPCAWAKGVEEEEGAEDECALLQLWRPQRHSHCGTGGANLLQGLRVPPDDFAKDVPLTPKIVNWPAPAGSCNQGNASALLPYEQWAIRDYPEEGTSTWGHLCFPTTQGETNLVAQSLFILGMKALSNFNYVYCKFDFDKLIQQYPDFIMGYYGRAMCESQLLWSSEDPVLSTEYLQKGREVQKSSGIVLSDREEAYYQAAELLNGVDRDQPQCQPGVASTMPCRLKAFASVCAGLYESYPWDANAGANVVLSYLALSTFVCRDFAPGKCSLQDGVRSFSSTLVKTSPYDTNPAFLHYALHAHDYPYRDIYESGLLYAELYPKVVNGSVHSLHMPSHIYMRAGKWKGAADSNHASVKAGDDFTLRLALRFRGGPVGSLSWNPATLVSGYGFAYDAGNVYHSLEYEAYEVLQTCAFPASALQTERMGIASFQALAKGGAQSIEMQNGRVANLNSAWYNATTYYSWLYRMEARLSQESSMAALNGNVGKAAEPLTLMGFGGVPSSVTNLPLPLAWNGATDYSNSFYAPQSEAGLWNAVGLASVLGSEANIEELVEAAFQSATAQDIVAALSANVSSAKPWAGLDLNVYPWEAGCGGYVSGMETGSQCVVQMGLQRISEVAGFYFSQNITYEGTLTNVLWLQLAAAQKLAARDLAGTLMFARQASELEWRAVGLALPSSSSLYFLPGTAFYGVLAARIARQAAKVKEFEAEVQALLQEAVTALDQCLSPQGRPLLATCVLARARIGNSANMPTSYKSPARAQSSWALYKELQDMYSYHGGKDAKEFCSKAYNEAAEAVATTCKQGDLTTCPGSGNGCTGNQCCPGTAASGGKTFPCPSASAGFIGCEVAAKIEDCLAA